MTAPLAPAAAVRPSIAALPDNRIVDIARHGWARWGTDNSHLIPLWFGEGDLPTPRFICDAAHRAMLDGHVFYGDQRGLPALREALARYLLRVYGVTIDDERLYVMTSGMNAIMIVAQTLVDPGDEVVVLCPVWPNIAKAVEVMGGVVRELPLEPVNGVWQFDLDRLAALVGPRTRALFINTPNNPTGWVMPAEDIARVLAFARARGLWIIADEVYSRLTYTTARAPSFLEQATADDRLLVVNSFSKNWAMTGWRLGWIVAPAGMSAIMQKMVQFNTSGTAGFIQMAGVTALEQGEPFVEEIRGLCARGREVVMETLSALPRLRLSRPDGAFYAFFRVEGEPDSLALARRLVDDAAVGLAPGSAFGAGGEGYLRLCYACSPERLGRAMERLVPALS